MQKTIPKYLFFRIKQAFRVLKDVGIGQLIILLPLLFVGVLGVLQGILVSQGVALGLFLLVIIGSIHWNRKDRFFLEQLRMPLFLFFLLDYILISSPFLGCFAFWAKWPNLGTTLLGIVLLSFVKPAYSMGANRKLFNLLNVKWIPLVLFEWRSGLRKNMLGFVLLYVLGLVFSYYPITVPVILFLMALGVASFFQLFENKDLLLAVNQHQKLLTIKVFGSLKLFNVLMLPHYILFVIFHFDYQYLGALLIVSIISQFIIIFSICLKYKNYRFHHHKVYNSLPMAIFVGCLTIPFLWPIPLIMLIHFWKKAQENLIHHYA